MAGKFEIQPQELTFECNGLRYSGLIWNDDSSAPVVLFCHGIMDSAWSFHHVAQPLAMAGYRVAAFDWRGHGRSEWISRGAYYHFPDYVLDLHDLVPQISNDRIHLVGHSMGGSVCAMYAATHPNMLHSLILAEGLGPPNYEGTASQKLRSWVDSMDRHRRRAPKIMKDLAEAVQRLRVRTPEIPAELAYFIAEKQTKKSFDAKGLIWRFDPLHRTTSPTGFSADAFKTYLSVIQTPTLILQGSEGYRSPDHNQRVMALPGARQFTIPNVGHMMHWLEPKRMAEQVVELISSC